MTSFSQLEKFMAKELPLGYRSTISIPILNNTKSILPSDEQIKTIIEMTDIKDCYNCILCRESTSIPGMITIHLILPTGTKMWRVNICYYDDVYLVVHNGRADSVHSYFADLLQFYDPVNPMIIKNIEDRLNTMNNTLKE
jgi:hypothetical protein